MGKFVVGLLIGLVIGLVFSENLFPDGFNNTVQHWAQGVRENVPGR